MSSIEVSHMDHESQTTDYWPIESIYTVYLPEAITLDQANDGGGASPVGALLLSGSHAMLRGQ